MGVEVKGAGDDVVIADRGYNDNCCCGNRNSGWGSGWNVAAVTSRRANRKSSVSSRILQKTRRLPALIE